MLGLTNEAMGNQSSAGSSNGSGSEDDRTRTHSTSRSVCN